MKTKLLAYYFHIANQEEPSVQLKYVPSIFMFVMMKWNFESEDFDQSYIYLINRVVMLDF